MKWLSKLFRRRKVLVFLDSDKDKTPMEKLRLPPVETPVMAIVLRVLRAEYATWSQIAIDPRIAGTPQHSHASGGACAIVDAISILTELSERPDPEG